MRDRLFYSLILVFCLVSAIKAENYTSPDGYPFEVNLKFPKATIMLGEPLYFDFEIKNLSNVELGAVFGGDYRNQFGRPETFEVKIIDSENNIVPKLKLMTMGGMVSAQKVPVGKNLDFRLYLPHWGTIEKPGKYQIQVERKQIIAKFDEKDHFTILNSKNNVPVKLTAEIKVSPANYQRMGQVIDEIGTQLIAQDDTAQRLVPFISDHRIIKYLAEAVEKNHFLMRYLARFNDDRAFNAIIKSINDEQDEVRRSVSVALSLSVHPQAPIYLLKMRTDKYYAIRLDVVHYLGKTKTKESTKLLKEMLNDEHKMIWDETRRYLTERGEKLD